jgi:Fic family protein
MKVPTNTPNGYSIITKIFSENSERGIQLIKISGPTDSKNRYLHWEKMQYLTPPEGFTIEEWWGGTKMARNTLYKELPFIDKNGQVFKFALPDCVLKELHWIDQNVSGQIASSSLVANPHTRDTYLMSSLFEEAINSSQLEGASTTWSVAKEMLRQGREPQDRSEHMIYNNYLAMEFIREFKNDPLTPAMILKLHRILTNNAMEDPGAAGRLRTKDDNVRVVDSQHAEELHTPPEANELPKRLERLCEFANAKETKGFIHPVIRGILLHFMLAYDHPFVDGNGRTARALFYWSMASQCYWLMEFVSISKIIKQAPVQYGKAYLYTENDENDTTYFIIHQLEVIHKAIAQLKTYLDKKSSEIEEAKKIIEGTKRLQGKLNFRQLSLLRHALEHPNAVYTIQGHQKSHAVTYQTARTDLLRMSEELKLLQKRKEGRTFVFIAPANLQSRLIKAKG